MRDLLIRISGARREILEQCPSERIKFQALGWSIVTTSVLGAVSMWFALSGPLGVNSFIAVPPALLWGVVLAGIERWFITSLPQRSRITLAVAVPRLVMGLLLSILVATPIVLRVFHSEIAAQVTITREQSSEALYKELQNGSVSQSVARYQAQIAQLQRIIDSGPTTPGYKQAALALPSAIRQLHTAETQLSTLQAQVQAHNSADNGLLSQLQALNQLAADNPTVQYAIIILFLLFVAIEILPLTVRTLQRPGVYEKILAAVAERELAEAQRAVRRSFRPSAPAGYADYPADHSTDVVRGIWQSVKDLPSPPRESSPAPFPAISSYALATEPLLEPKQSDEHTAGRDELLAMMDDQREPDGIRSTGGIPLTWDDDLVHLLGATDPAVSCAR